MSNEKYNQIIDEVYSNYGKSHTTFRGGFAFVTPMEHSKETFVNECKTDPEFSKTWGLKIEERELSLEERYDLIEKDKHIQFVKCESLGTDRIKEVLDKEHVPTKLITLTYNNETIESYE